MDERDRRKVERGVRLTMFIDDVAVDDAPLMEVHEAGDDAPHGAMYRRSRIAGNRRERAAHRRISGTVGARPICWESERIKCSTGQ